jgi:hypothetical protein
MTGTDLIHPVYMPFTSETLQRHFAPVPGRSAEQLLRHLGYYTSRAAQYVEFCACTQYPIRRGFPLATVKEPCQIEEDERFWSAACWLTFFYHEQRAILLSRLMAHCIGPRPPLNGFGSWSECFSGRLHLFFEARLPALRRTKCGFRRISLQGISFHM